MLCIHRRHHWCVVYMVCTCCAYCDVDGGAAARLSAEATLAVPTTPTADHGSDATPSTAHASSAITLPDTLPAATAHPSAPTATTAPLYASDDDDFKPLIRPDRLLSILATTAQQFPLQSPSSFQHASAQPAARSTRAMLLYLSRLTSVATINPEKIEAHLWSKANTLLTIQVRCGLLRPCTQ